MKGVSSVLEYTYLDVKNLNDPDNGKKIKLYENSINFLDTMAKLNIYLMDDIKQKLLLFIICVNFLF